ncbi:MAG: type 4a pilus biogenesis protein PilO, partial [Gammaproteobacteria bacterium]
MQNINLEELKLDEIGLWPTQFRYAALLLLTLISLGAFYYLSISPVEEQIAALIAEQQTLKSDFDIKSSQLKDKSAYEVQMKDIEVLIKNLLRKFPRKNEISMVLKELSQQTWASGVIQKSISPKNEVSTQNYNYQNIELILEGNYHDFGVFLSNLSRVQRLITTHNFS